MKSALLLLGLLACYGYVAVQASLKPDPNAGKPREYKGLKYIGNWTRKEVPKGGRGPEGRSGAGAAITMESRYLISTSKATWEEAGVMCPVITEGRGVLVKIESAAEDKIVHDYVRSASVRRTNELIWTDGVSDESAKWVWNTNNEKIEYKHFRVPDGPNGFLAFRSINNAPTQYEWVPVYNSEDKNYYLCELETEDVPMPCYKENDLVIVLDASMSVEPDEYIKAKSFVAKLANVFQSPSRISFMTYSSEVEVVFGLTSTPDMKMITDNVQSQKNTFTGGGIEEATKELEKMKRDGIPRKIVVLTDGWSNKPTDLTGPQYTIDATKNATALGITVFSVGIGIHDSRPEFDQELLTIANNIEAHKFTVFDFNQLLKSIRPISITICNTP